MTHRFPIAVGLLTLAFALPVYAQLSLNYEKPLTLTISPEHPAPGETVRMSIASYALDLDRSHVVWRANNAIIAEGDGLKEAPLTLGFTNDATDISVDATDGDGQFGRAIARISPSQVDIVWNSDSYVPPFYEGRALAGTNAMIRAYAVALLPMGSSTVPEKDIIYTWSRNGAVVASGRGKSSITVPGPMLFSTDTISVVAEAADRASSGSAEVRIPSTDATLMLYENHPLFGVLYHRAIVGDVNTNETEQKVTAVPFFAHIVSPEDAGLAYDWHVNDTPITADADEPQTLTITSNDYVGPANVSLTLTSARDIFMRAAGAWRLNFGENPVGFFTNGGTIFGR